MNYLNAWLGYGLMGCVEDVLYLRAGVKNLQVQLPAIDGEPFMVQGICDGEGNSQTYSNYYGNNYNNKELIHVTIPH